MLSTSLNKNISFIHIYPLLELIFNCRKWLSLKNKKCAIYYGRIIAVVVVLFIYLNIHLDKNINTFNTGNASHRDSKKQIAPQWMAEEPPQDDQRQGYPEIQLGHKFVLNISSRKINRFNYSFLINEPEACQTSPKLVIIVIGAANNFVRRRAIRLTWANQNRLQTMSNVILFMVAVRDTEIQKKLETESERYHDILQPNFLDSYDTLPLKSISILKWIMQYCKSSRFVLKTDDDVYVNIPILLQLLQMQPNAEFILGKENYNISVRRVPGDRYYVSAADYPYKAFPPYLQGVGYVISAPAVPRLYDAALHVPLVRLEDVYVTGFCRIRSGVSMIRTTLFKTEFKGSLCDLRFLALLHGYGRHRKLLRIHRRINSNETKCEPI